jgi:predicted kinase
MLIIFSGLPGTGKSTISRELAKQIDGGAMHLRIDSIEHVIFNSPSLKGEVYDVGYRIAYAVAADNLRLGRTVISDSVNDIAITRESWHDVAIRCGVRWRDVEVICSDIEEHRRRVESRVSDIEGFKLPTWAKVESREYERWPVESDAERIVIDTAKLSVEEAVARIRSRLR